jgi:hypothetical protein
MRQAIATVRLPKHLVFSRHARLASSPLIRLALALLAIVTLPGCWMIRAHHLANSIESDIPLNDCIRNTGVEPIELASCIRHSKNKRAANACEPPPQEAAVKACIRDCPTHIFRATVCVQPTS